jgi:hypothetical protein
MNMDNQDLISLSNDLQSEATNNVFSHKLTEPLIAPPSSYNVKIRDEDCGFLTKMLMTDKLSNFHLQIP